MRREIVFVGLVAAVAAVAPAHAGGVVLEAYTGGRPPDVDKYMKPMFGVLEKAGFIDNDGVRRPFESDVSRPSLEKTGLPIDYEAQLDAAFAMFGSASYHAAIAKLSPLVEMAHANNGAFVGREPLRNGKLRKAHVMLGLSQIYDGDRNGGLATLADMNRAFPDERVPVSTWGGPANKAYQDAIAANNAFGNLTVTAPGNGGIYIDEKLEGVGGVQKQHLAAGTYRVFVQGGNGVSRTHLVAVGPGKDAAVTIEADFDQAVHTEGWVGLEFPDAATRARTEAVFAAKFGNALNADQIVVVGIDTVQGKPSVVASLISKSSGERIRGAQVPLPSATPEQMANLGHYITGDGATGDVIPLTNQPATPPEGNGGGGHVAGGGGGGGGAGEGHIEPARPGVYKWGAFVLGTAAIAGGVIALHYDGACSETLPNSDMCKQGYHTKVGSIISISGGAVLEFAAFYLFFLDPKSEPMKTAFIVPTQGGAYAGYSIRF